MSGRRPSLPLSGSASRFRPSAWLAAAALTGAVSFANPAFSEVLVSNFNQQGTNAPFTTTLVLAPAFTTGANPAGYALTSIELKFHTAPTGLTVKLAKGRPSNPTTSGPLIVTLSNPATLGTGTHTFTAPSGTTLSAGTTYHVIVDGIPGAGRAWATTSDNEDAGGESGWSIKDTMDFWRPNSQTWGSDPFAVQMRVNGSPISSPDTAAPEAQKRVLKGALGAVASRTVSGALDTLGTRMGDGVPASGLKMAGLNLSGPNPAGQHALAGPEDVALSGPAGFDGPSGGGSRGMTPDELLGSGAFSYTLGAAKGEPSSGPDAPRWGVWGRGDFGTFAGRGREGRADVGSRYDGDLRIGWLGADARGARGSGRWVAGLAVSRGTSKTDYMLDGEWGRIETGLTALWPYGRWTYPGGLELRGLLGAGRGEVRIAAGDGEPEKSDLTMWAASVGLGRPLPPLGGIGHGIDLAARGDASIAFMETERGDGAVDGFDAAVSRVRGGVEASRRIAMADGASLTPFAELAGRMDGGDGVTGPGVELAGGLRYAGPRVAVEVRGRWLAAHTEKGAEERGVSLTARLDPGALGRGLSASLAPRWGAGTDGADKLWRDEMPGASGASEAGGFEGELGYGMPAFGGRFTGTPNAGFGQSDGGGRDYRVGWRLTPAVGGHPGFEVSLDATRREAAGGATPAHGTMLRGEIRW